MKMQNAEMEFVVFDAQDVIATSTTGGGERTFTLSGMYDGKRNNISFVDSNGTFKLNGSANDVMTAFRSGTLGDLKVRSDTAFYASDEQLQAAYLFNTANDMDNDKTKAALWNGVYKWVTDHFQKIQ